MFKKSSDGLLCRCVAGREVDSIMWHCHSSTYEVHHSGERTTSKILQSGFLWPILFNYCKLYVFTCPGCNKTGNISKRDEMHLNIMLEVEPFDCWEIDFMGAFPQPNAYLYILVCVDYVIKWMKAIVCSANDARTIINFLKKNFFLSGAVYPRYLLVTEGCICNRYSEQILEKYNVKHKVSIPYHPQTCGQVEVSNKQLKQILEKTVVTSRKDWSTKLDDVL